MDKQKSNEVGNKKVWVKPQLTVYGDIEKITNTCGPTTNSGFSCSSPR